jgi:putative ABC transport system permease protein
MKAWEGRGSLKYFPLVWAALRRKPVRTAVTFLSVTVAFTLFGLMIGLSSTLDLMQERARADRIWVWPRFDNAGMPVTVARQIAQLPGVKKVTVMSYLQGYVGDPKNHLGMAFFDDEYGNIFPDWGPSPEQWEAIRRNRTAVVMSRSMAKLYNKKVGDTLTVIAPQVARADGTRTWTFKVVAIGEDVTANPGGYFDANYDYYDKSVPLADQGKMNEVDILATDPALAPALALRIDRLFANSASPTQANTEKSLLSGNAFGGMDVNKLTREIALAGLLMILFLTANVIAQSVRERLAELATLMAMGYFGFSVVALVALEAALICVSGAVCGIAIAAALAAQVPMLLPRGWGMPLPTLSAGVFFWALTSACVLALASAALPALRLRRLDVASALSGCA